MADKRSGDDRDRRAGGDRRSQKRSESPMGSSRSDSRRRSTDRDPGGPEQGGASRKSYRAGAERTSDRKVAGPTGKPGERRTSGDRRGSKPGDMDGRPPGGRSGPGSRSGKVGDGDPRGKSERGVETRGSKSGRPSDGGRSEVRAGRRDGGRGERFGSDRAGAGPRRDRPGRDRSELYERTVDQATYDGPPLSDHITGEELDRDVAQQLRGLPEKLANRVARHLVAAGELIDTEPEVAFQHALAARARAGRLAVVREAVGEAAYAAGRYTEALADLRAAKRMNGATAYLPIMADCHRALGRPEQALKLARSEGVANFGPEAKAEMTIVEAGARRDLGQLDAALRTLELAPLMSKSRAPWVVRLRYAYADTLEHAGRFADALAWFHRAHAVDADEITDADERAQALERRLSE